MPELVLEGERVRRSLAIGLGTGIGLGGLLGLVSRYESDAGGCDGGVALHGWTRARWGLASCGMPASQHPWLLLAEGAVLLLGPVALWSLREVEADA